MRTSPAQIERQAMAEAEKLVRQGAPGVKREDLVRQGPEKGDPDDPNAGAVV